MLKKIHNSLAYRLPDVYRNFLRRKKLKAPTKNSSEITVLMMAGKKHKDLLRFSVWSIARFWKTLPQLIVNTDGTITPNEIKEALDFWSGNIHIQDWQDSTFYHQAKQRSSIVEYAEKDPFGKKLAFILHQAELQPVLWIDCDILFFQDFTPYLPTPDTSKNDFCGSEDWIEAYDDNVLKYYPYLSSLPPISTGIFWAFSESSYENENLEHILAETFKSCTHFTEQTILANLAYKYSGIRWDRNLIKNFMTDRQTIVPARFGGSIARHYTNNVRHLFWRDCLLLYLKFNR